MPDRIMPNTEGREAYLSSLKKAELRAECDLLAEALEDAQAELELAPGRVDPNNGLQPLVLHVSGVEWNGTHRRLVRCASSGPLADYWLAQVGGKMLTTAGQPIPFIPYRHVSASLQDKVRHTLAGGLAVLTKA